MSTRVLSRDSAASAKQIQWPSAGDALREVEKESAGVPENPPVEDEIAGRDAKIALLEQELNALRQDAEQKAREAQLAGRREGEAVARQALDATVKTQLAALNRMMNDVTSAGPALRRQAEEDLVKLSIAIARRILHREILVDGEALLGLTKAALGKLDQREVNVIRTHPDSIELVQRVLEEGGINRPAEISGDARLERGALIIETVRGQLDASVETQLREIERGFADVFHRRP